MPHHCTLSGYDHRIHLTASHIQNTTTDFLLASSSLSSSLHTGACFPPPLAPPYTEPNPSAAERDSITDGTEGVKGDYQLDSGFLLALAIFLPSLWSLEI